MTENVTLPLQGIGATNRRTVDFHPESTVKVLPTKGVNGNCVDDSSDSASVSSETQAIARPRMTRKASSPMAPTFMVSAPGKVIVFGEHAVVHGKAAMAAAISLRSYLLVTTLSKSQRTITLNFRDLGLSHTWDIDTLPWDKFHEPTKKKFYYSLVTELDPELVEAIQPHLQGVSKGLPEEQRNIHIRSASSSASVCVCLSSALLLQIRTLSGPHPDQPPEEAETQIERINRWAFVGELCIHGNPSGVDNTVSAGGKAVIFRRDDYSKPPTVISLPNFPELPLLLVNTQQARSTKTEVSKVGALRDAHPIVTESILNGIDHVTCSAQRLIEDPSFEGICETTLAHFGTLIRINHGFLVSPRRLSPPSRTHSRWWVCDYLLRPNAKAEVKQDLEQKFDKEGFATYEVILGGDGVGVLYPAVLRNGSDEEGGEEIDQQKFENAEGPEGIERLVGVGVEEKRGAGSSGSELSIKPLVLASVPPDMHVT
ncbi:hypothetical protein N7519_010924 [Penicillium mononematosum]|uniref:uncharacterized protein n=1 Tax=Penicillium mononematosum TaxID=268346 RepID=UPI002548E720|nr:uncharacterized protein N7519_010924 [Penicillium mononematosum]KAJ6180463.1 hypothetical protein N7519_010924 [Penicillium mononematosum]